ncbi:MAG TPA: alpha/beta fold hydrolase [Blastocatellia bacterium]
MALLAGLLIQGISIAGPGTSINGVQAQANAANGRTIEGIWQGSIETGGPSVRIIFKISKDPKGVLAATMDSPDQGARELHLEEVTFQDDRFHCALKIANASFEGTLNKDGSELSGHWAQNDHSLPLTLIRVDKEPETRRPQDPVRPYPYDEEEVAYDNKQAPGVRLAGTLTIPRGGNPPYPVVLLITGSGPQDRDEALLGHRPFLVLSDYLTRHGIEVLRVDDRGTAKSTGNFATATTEDFASDVRAGIEFLKTRKEVNHKQIGLIGHSEGAIIAPMVAATSPDVGFIVMMAGTSITGEEVVLLQGALISKAEGASEDELARSRAIQKSLFDIIKEEKDNSIAEKKVEDILNKANADLPDPAKRMPAATITAQAKAFTSPWFRFFAFYDPKPALKKVKCPVLALNGSNDLQVPPSANLPGIAQALEAGGNMDYEIDKLHRLNHLFQTSQTGSPSEYSKIDETISPVALDIISSWIIRHTIKSVQRP